MDNEYLESQRLQYPPFIPEESTHSPESSPLDPDSYTRLHASLPALPSSTPPHTLPRSRSRGAKETRANSPQNDPLARRPRRRTSLSTMLVVTNERLAQQTALTRSLQSQSDDVFAVLRTTYQNNLSLQSNLRQAESELALYKLRLEMADGEIRKAEEVVKAVDLQRVEAEERSVRDRERLRKMIVERAVWAAREEGLKEGYHQGLEHGRRMVWSTALKAENPDGSHIEEASEESLTGSSRSRRAISTSPTSRHRPRGPSISSQATSVPIRIPSRQSQPRIHDPVTDSPRRRSRTPISSQPPRQPTPLIPAAMAPSTIPNMGRKEDYPPLESIRPVPDYQRPPSPSMSHRSMVVPPDGYIPTKSPGAQILLPPPHELAIPVAYDDDGARSVRSGISRSVPRDIEESRPPRQPPRSRAMSVTSRASTRISEYDLVSPPRGAEIRDRRFASSNTRTPRSPGDLRVEEWRSNSTDVVSPTPRRMYKIANADPGVEDEIKETRSMHSNSTQGRRARIRPRTGPRPPREIIFPTPLSGQPLAGNHLPRTNNSIYATPNVQEPPGVRVASPVTPTSPPVVQQQIYDSSSSSSRKTPLAWLRSRFQRMASSPNVPTNINIEVEPPSASPSTGTNTATVVDPVLLTPEPGSRGFTPIIASEVQKPNGISSEPITMVLPDDKLPLGFIPQSIPMSMPTDIVAMNVTAGPSSAPSGSYFDSHHPLQPTTTGTTFEVEPQASTSPRVRASTFTGYLSPAPLDRPISLFSDG